VISVPRAALPVRVLNVLRRALPQRAMSPGALIDAARRDTGLEDFGPDGPFEQALGVLCDALDAEASLTPVGRMLVRRMLLQGLKTQLQLQDWRRRHPEIGEQPIERPVFIVGMPRTGTSILHELMALDPANRCPLSWELAHPFPPPESATFSSDPRIAAYARELRFSHYLMPGIENMHRMGSELPQECVAITAYAFVSMQLNTIFHVPSYTRWLEQKADHTAVYRFHRRFLQYLQWRCPRERWVLKSPAHLWQIEALMREYPEAKLVQTHRDPLKIVSSLASMIPTLRSAYATDIDPLAVAREWSENCASALNASLASRRAGTVRPGQVVDIQFRDFMHDPVGEVRRVYALFDLPFSDRYEEAIRAYIAANPADKHGGHRHRFEDTGLDVLTERRKTDAYRHYFEVTPEI
jgi:hypothetical protein